MAKTLLSAVGLNAISPWEGRQSCFPLKCIPSHEPFLDRIPVLETKAKRAIKPSSDLAEQCVSDHSLRCFHLGISEQNTCTVKNENTHQKPLKLKMDSTR